MKIVNHEDNKKTETNRENIKPQVKENAENPKLFLLPKSKAAEKSGEPAG